MRLSALFDSLAPHLTQLAEAYYFVYIVSIARTSTSSRVQYAGVLLVVASLLLSCGGSGSQSASPSRGLISSAVKNAVIPSNARNVTLPNKGAAPSESKSSGSSIAPDVAQEVVIDASKSDATLRLVDSSPTTASPTTIAFTPSEPNPTSTSQPFPVQIPTPIDVAPPNVVFTR